MMTDPIADFLTRLRNAGLARHESVRLRYSSVKHSIATVLKAEGYVDDVRREPSSAGVGDELVVVLRYGKDRCSAIDGIRRVSSPGRRRFVRSKEIGVVRSGLGVAVLSTSKGVMTDRSAKANNLGGELLCEVW
jgi:small subunit ribosomal protein S8